MNREILRIAVPNIISNITVPLMGIASTFIAGRVAGADGATTIGALSIGVAIFNFIYWNCSFIRMGTSGLTAQAYGANEHKEYSLMLWRAVCVALGVGIAAFALQWPIGEFSLWFMSTGDSSSDAMIADYFYTRIWAVPAGIMLFAFNGWLTGMQNAVIPMAVAILVNVLHICFSYLFSIVGDYGLEGIALASVVAQWTGVATMVVIIVAKYRHRLVRVSLSEVMELSSMRRFFSINSDIIIRTFCLVAVYTFFTKASADMGDKNILAVNTILLQLFTLFSYMNDGFAYAAEALTGRFIGARDSASLRKCIKLCVVWCFVVSFIYVGVYVGWWRDIFSLLVDSENSDLESLLAVAEQYIGWIIIIPIASALPFVMDGIMVGATRSRIMRNSMIWSSVCYFVLLYGSSWLIGNNAIWLAFTSYMFLRGVFQYFMSDRLRDIYREAERVS
ncbi:MAG: MATE family efflux transporter [Alistipes sp.]|nr:MATE family efflux transporter [Alistipes sp.]